MQILTNNSPKYACVACLLFHREPVGLEKKINTRTRHVHGRNNTHTRSIVLRDDDKTSPRSALRVHCTLMREG